jgi:hypothetical protein
MTRSEGQDRIIRIAEKIPQEKRTELQRAVIAAAEMNEGNNAARTYLMNLIDGSDIDDCEIFVNGHGTALNARQDVHSSGSDQTVENRELDKFRSILSKATSISEIRASELDSLVKDTEDVRFFSMQFPFVVSTECGKFDYSSGSFIVSDADTLTARVQKNKEQEAIDSVFVDVETAINNTLVQYDSDGMIVNAENRKLDEDFVTSISVMKPKDIVKKYLFGENEEDIRSVRDNIIALWNERSQARSAAILQIMQINAEYIYKILIDQYYASLYSRARKMTDTISSMRGSEKEEAKEEIQKVELLRTSLHRGIEEFANRCMLGRDIKQVRHDIEEVLRAKMEDEVFTTDILEGNIKIHGSNNNPYLVFGYYTLQIPERMGESDQARKDWYTDDVTNESYPVSAIAVRNKVLSYKEAADEAKKVIEHVNAAFGGDIARLSETPPATHGGRMEASIIFDREMILQVNSDAKAAYESLKEVIRNVLSSRGIRLRSEYLALQDNAA